MGRELPILFDTDTVCAVLRKPPENKTATRRAIKGYIPMTQYLGTQHLRQKVILEELQFSLEG